MNRLHSIMKKVYSLIKTVALLIVAFYFFMFAIIAIPQAAGFLALLVVVVVLPIAKWQNILSRVLPRPWIKVVLAIVLMMSAIIAWQPVSEEMGAKEKPKPTAEAVVTAPVQVTEEPAVSLEPIDTTALAASHEPTPVAETAAPTPVPASEIMDLIEDAGKNHLDYFVVEGDETGITVTMAMNGIAEELIVASNLGHDETSEPWASHRETVLDFYFLFEDLLEAKGRSDLVLMVNLVNDTNYDNCLLSAYRGDIVYDEMAVRSGHVPIKQEVQAMEPESQTEGQGSKKADLTLFCVPILLIVFYMMYKRIPKRLEIEDNLVGSSGVEPEIIYVEVLNDGVKYSTRTSTSSAIGRGLVGGALFGPVGAIVGGSTGKRKTTQRKGWSVAFLVCYDDGSKKTETVARGSDRYIELMRYTK